MRHERLCRIGAHDLDPDGGGGQGALAIAHAGHVRPPLTKESRMAAQ
jgi:hypothetical protein